MAIDDGSKPDDRRHLRDLAYLSTVSGFGILAASLAHELNQPLAAALSNAQAARRLLASGAPPAMLAEILDDIIDQERRAADIVERIRRLLRGDSLDWTHIDVNALTRDVTHLVAHHAELESVAVVSELAHEAPLVCGDRVQLQQVLLNLMLNAIQASRSAADRRRPTVWVTTGSCDGKLQLRVRDSGPGVDQAMRGRIFKPFYTTKPDGMGLGLFISQSVVEAHGGLLSVANAPGAGAEFSVVLPLVAAL